MISRILKCLLALTLLLFAVPAEAQRLWDLQSVLSGSAISTGADDVTSCGPAFDGGGNSVITWTLAGETTSVIMVARSADGGENWAAPTVLFGGSIAGGSRNEDSSVATDAAGNWIAVWSTDDPLSGTKGTDLDVVYSRSTDSGATWSWPALVNSNAVGDPGFDIAPRIATDRSGNWVVAWTSDNEPGLGLPTLQPRVWTCRSSDLGASWSAATAAVPNPPGVGKQHCARIASGGSNQFVLAYLNVQDGIGQYPAITSSSDGGATWAGFTGLDCGAACIVPRSLGPSLDLATDTKGKWIVTWHGATTNEAESPISIMTSRSPDGAQSWSDTQTAYINASDPRICTDGAGTWALGMVNRDSATYYSQSRPACVGVSANDGATWSLPMPVQDELLYSVSAIHDHAPVLLPKPSGDWCAVFASAALSGRGDKDLLVSTSRLVLPPLPDPGWFTAQVLKDDHFTTGVPGFFPRMRNDGALTCMIVFGTHKHALQPISGPSDIAISTSMNGGDTWSPVRLLLPYVASDAENDTMPDVATNGSGKWMCVWASYTGDYYLSPKQIRYAVSTDSGLTWSPGVPGSINEPTTVGSVPRVAACGPGCWCIAYQSVNGIRYRRSLDDGITWSDSVPVRTDWVNGICGSNQGCEQEHFTSPDIEGSCNGVVGVGYRSAYTKRFYLSTMSRDATGGANCFVPGQVLLGVVPAAGLDTDDAGTWIGSSISQGRYSDSPWNNTWMRQAFVRSTNDGVSFSSATLLHPHPTRSDTPGLAVCQRPGSWCFTWRGNGYANLAEAHTWELVTYSTDGGNTWGVLNHLETRENGTIVTPTSSQISGANDRWLHVWSAPDGTIWCSRKLTPPASTAASIPWELFE